MLKLSLCLTGWEKPWLLEKALYWLNKQSLPKDEWELVFIDDNSSEPLAPYLDPYRDSIQIRDFRLEHNLRWRGITGALLYAYRQAKAPVLAQTNGHLLLPADSLELLLAPHEKGDNYWVSLRGFTLNTEATEKLDTVDWRESVGNLWQIPDTDCEWTKLWLDRERFYATHLCCSIRKETFWRVNPWPEALDDYGTDDPLYANARRRVGIQDLNIFGLETMFGHLAHNNFQHDAMELNPGIFRLNRWGHTVKTSHIWDGGKMDMFTLEEVIDFWERGEHTTDWRVRNAWGWFRPDPWWYIQKAKELRDELGRN